MTRSGLNLGAKREGLLRWELSSPEPDATHLGLSPVYKTTRCINLQSRVHVPSFLFFLICLRSETGATLMTLTSHSLGQGNMDNYHYALTPEQLQSFQENGYLLVRGFFNPEESKVLQQWAQEVHDLPQTPGVPWMPYEEVNGQGQRVLCRTENFANSHSGFDSFLRGQRATSALQQLAGEQMLLFKEKINYKLAGSGTSPHSIIFCDCHHLQIVIRWL